jgi:tRNA 2-thiocytidine biosynthesis protein TtcA
MSDPTTCQRHTFFLLKQVNRTIRDYGLIADGDKIAVGVSGGKDSVGLLHLLDVYRPRARAKYDLLAVHVHDPANPADDPTWRESLAAWLDARGIEYAFAPMEVPDSEPRPLGCFRCAWHRRKALFTAAHARGYTTVALAHHADDVAETVLMNLASQGRLQTMAPRQALFDGQITVIRPLFHVPESEMVRLASRCDFPPPPPPCPQAATSGREHARLALRELRAINPLARENLWKAIKREASKRQMTPDV